MTQEIQTATATTIFEIITQCPYCGEYQDQRKRLTEHLDYGSLSAEKCEAEITCSAEDCKRVFIVDSIIY